MEGRVIRHKLNYALPALVLVALLFVPELCFANLESSLMGIKTKLTGIVLPSVAVIGVLLAGVSFFTGNPNAKQHIVYAILGCCFGFGSQAIVDFIKNTVN